MRSIGLLLLFITSLMTGIYLAGRLRERVRMIDSIRSAVQTMRRMLDYEMPQLSVLLSSCCSTPAAEILAAAASEIESGLTPLESADKALSGHSSSLIGEDVAAVVRDVINGIGRSDRESACRLLDDAERRLTDFLQAAREREIKESRITVSLSIYAGAAAVILLM